MLQELTAIDTWSSTLRISKTQMQTFLICPLKFQFQYVLGLEPEHVPVNLPFGKAIHETAASFYRQIQATGQKPELAELLDDWSMFWNVESADPAIAFDSKITPETVLEQGKGMLEKFHKDVAPRKVEAIEYPFEVPLVDPDTGEPTDYKMVGVMDLVESDEDRTLIVSELKTSSKRYSDLQAEDKLDGLAYAYALEALGFHTTAGATLVRYDVMVKTKEPSFQQLYIHKDAGDLRRFARWVKQILRAIENESFFAQVGWACKDCQFRRACKRAMEA